MAAILIWVGGVIGVAALILALLGGAEAWYMWFTVVAMVGLVIIQVFRLRELDRRN